ncbi:ABC transporter ATP-binding protein [Lichenihabitans sp. Uapishka_5]|uniref:ABC transporter ATP-binding protein n=1 Tax=Lichenihabitans sp. Uapishka_5 TaxID=3037302 RepID=UPI0029E8107F|nr:ABC transporter ATP-binding protein [Lichenihabitans sp. Uapishka_5]MDX7953831.1 ABC transporter ATP-binding protein [Lichenihabitans sp. Uapishka_5]
MAPEPEPRGQPLLRLVGVTKRFNDGAVLGLDNVDLTIRQGEFLSLLGPSGCGKTTSLRIIAGFEAPTTGRVELDGRDITATRAYERPVNTVFQDYALFPHMTVAENVGFGLTTRRLSTPEVRRRTAAMLDLVGLADKQAARVGALSGGQRQRVALARAVVCEPRLLLLDEPLSALDAHLREQMQIELKGLQSKLGTTFVMVTHDQTEALSISDRIVVMNRGRIEQAASPAELYDAPATTFVAGFIGTMNLIEGRTTRGTLVEAGPLRLHLATPGPAEGVVVLGVRPEDVTLSTEPGPETASATVSNVVFHGRSLRLSVQVVNGPMLTVDVPRAQAPEALAPGLPVFAAIRPGTARSLIRS